MKTLNNIQIIIDKRGVFYNYGGVLYTKEQFEEIIENKKEEL